MKVYETLNLLDPDTVVGKHSVWLPALQVKVPFQFAGRIQKYRHPEEATYALDLLAEEVGLLRWLADRAYAPPIGDWVYFKTVVSEHPGGWWADPCGAYGYEMADATALPTGPLDGLPVSETIQAAVGDLIQASPGAWNDLNKPGNVVNGYVIDARRSGWDRLHWKGPLPALPRYEEDRAALHADLLANGQFPAKARTLPYQEYYLDGRWHAGEREVISRAEVFHWTPKPNMTVLDIGTCLGGFLQFAHVLGARRLIGLDVDPDYIDLARRLARANGMNICFRLMNAEAHTEDLVQWMHALAPEGIETLLLLSMLKHFAGGEGALWKLVDYLNAKVSFLETNAVKEGAEVPLRQGVLTRFGTLVGWSRDRNRRACFQVDRY
jgi:hypothetical protein